MRIRALIAAVAAFTLCTQAFAQFIQFESTGLISEHYDPNVPHSSLNQTFIDSAHAVSRTGQFVVFYSSGLGLAPGQDNVERNGLFVRGGGGTTQLKFGTTPIDGVTPSISNDGRYVAFVSLPSSLGLGGSFPSTAQVFVLDRQTGALGWITAGLTGSGANNASLEPMISADGHSVVYSSYASNLVTGDTNGVADIFVTDIPTRITRRVSLSNAGRQSNGNAFAPYVTRDGRYIAYFTQANNLVVNSGTQPGVYLYDRVAQRTELESVNTRGMPAEFGGDEPSLSDDGRYVAFTSRSRNLLPLGANPHLVNQIFVRDRVSGRVICASISAGGEVGNDDSVSPSIDGVGRFVAFSSLASNLVPGDTNALDDPATPGGGDAFVHDLKVRATKRASVRSAGGEQARKPGFGYFTSISGDGKYVVFDSQAPNLIPPVDEVTLSRDVFGHTILPRIVIRVNAGGAPYTDQLLREWSGDTAFSGGVSETWLKPITNTQDSNLYQNDRSGPGMTYHFAVPAGTYLLRLHFAENYIPCFQTGKRVFDVSVNRIQRIASLDVYAQVGARAALVKEVTVTTPNADGLTIGFIHRTLAYPIIDAIEVIQQ